MLKRFAQILALAVPLLLVACNSSTTTSGTGTDTGTLTTAASYTGTYTGTSTGVNSGPSTMVIAADKSIKGTFTINNRTDDNGVPAIYEATFDGTVSSTGAVNVNSFLEGALVMIFTGQIDANGLLTGTYIEAAHPNDPSKHGTFSLQGPKTARQRQQPQQRLVLPRAVQDLISALTAHQTTTSVSLHAIARWVTAASL